MNLLTAETPFSVVVTDVVSAVTSKEKNNVISVHCFLGSKSLSLCVCSARDPS